MSCQFSTEGKTNLKELEGSEEVFVDMLDDLGIFEMKEGDTIKHGDCENVFECYSSESSTEENGFKTVSSLINVKFYENKSKITLKSVVIFDDDGDVNDLELFWFDDSNNDIPSGNSNWAEILENMDIFWD